MSKRRKRNNNKNENVFNFKPITFSSLQNFNINNFRTINNDLTKEQKILSGGQSNPNLAPFNFNKQQKRPNIIKNPKINSEYPIKKNVKTPKGTKWQNVTAHVNHHVRDYENTDVYSDFDGWFNLEKKGNKYHCWVTLKDAHVINNQGKPGREITGYDKPIADKTWTDKSDHSKYSFALSSIAAFFGKHNIYEDEPQNGSPMIYHDINMGCRAVKYWNVFDGGNDISKPHIIAHKGENIIIDTGRMKVYKTDGTDLTKYTSFESTFPPLYGNQINNIDFYPTIGQGCDVDVAYVPRIR